MTNLLLSVIFVLFSNTPEIETFEGSIKLIQESCYETCHYTYIIKDENIRIDKFDGNKTIIESTIINLTDKNIYVLCPSKKLYSQITTRPAPSIDSNVTILKTENSKMINNYMCYQWRVKNTVNNTEIAFWVSENNFYFFAELVKLMEGLDNSFLYFDKIPDSKGFFPMLTVERTLLRKEKRRLSVVQIDEKEIDANIFVIPTDYKLLESNP